MEKLEAAIAKHNANLKAFTAVYGESAIGPKHRSLLDSAKEVETALAEAKATPAPAPTTV